MGKLRQIGEDLLDIRMWFRLPFAWLQGIWHLLEVCKGRGTSEPLCRTLLRDDGGESQLT